MARINGINLFLLLSTFSVLPSQALAQPERVLVLLEKGDSEKKQANYDEALAYFLEADRLCRNNNYGAQCTEVFMKIAKLYGQLGQYEKSKSYLSQALKNNLAVNGASTELASIYNNLGIVEKKNGEFEQAIEYYNLSAQIKQREGDSVGLARSYNNIGEVYKELSQYDSTLNYLNVALAIHNELENVDGIAGTLNNIGSVFRRQGKYLVALKYYHQSYPLAVKAKNTHLQRRLHLYISDSYAAIGEPDSALGAYRNYAELNDSIFRLEAFDKIAEIEARHQLAQFEKDKALAEQKNQQNTLILSFLVLVVLVIGGTAFLWQRKKIATAQTTAAMQEEAIEKGRKEASVMAHELFHQINNDLVCMQIYYRSHERSLGDDLLVSTIKRNTKIANRLWQKENDEATGVDRDQLKVSGNVNGIEADGDK